MNRRVTFVALALATIAVGLLVHLHGSSLGTTAQDITGDALYAMMIAWWIGALAPNTRLLTRTATAYAVCATIELSQLYHAAFIDAARATRLGQLVLGTGFDSRDLASYAIGVTITALLESMWRRTRSR